MKTNKKSTIMIDAIDAYQDESLNIEIVGTP
jgi:hypothetical protein